MIEFLHSSVYYKKIKYFIAMGSGCCSSWTRSMYLKMPAIYTHIWQTDKQNQFVIWEKFLYPYSVFSTVHWCKLSSMIDLSLLASALVRWLSLYVSNWYLYKMSKLQCDLPTHVNPSPLYPALQAHVKLPSLFVQLAAELQPAVSVSHSSISMSSQVNIKWIS